MKRADVIEIEITGYAFGGMGIGKIQTGEGHFVVFVENAIPGQLVRTRIAKKRKNYAEGKLLEILRKSSDERGDLQYQPVSGAPYIFLPIEKQREYKKISTLDQYIRIGGIKNIESIFDEYIASPADFNYRNKMEYSFSSIRQDLITGEEEDDAFALGFKTRGTWWKVENLDQESGLFDQELEIKLKEIRHYLFSTNLPAWHPPKKTGFYRHLVVRKSFDQNQLLMNLVTSSQGIEQFDRSAFSNYMQELFNHRLAGLQHTVNDDVADRSKIENGENQLLVGKPVVTEKILGLEFEISMESFFQTNPKSAELLYNKAIDYVVAQSKPEGSLLLDLFCGTGTIGQVIASRLKNIHVVGVDIVEQAIEDAKRNAKRNNIPNIRFFAEDAGKFLQHHPEYNGKIHTIVLDPPRAGIAPKTLQRVIDLDATQIVYISCNPSTQARDAKTLLEAGYNLEKISLVDQFPHTAHIEAVALFVKDQHSPKE